MELHQPLTRRSFAKLVAGAALAAVPAARAAGEVSAGRTWCRKDPVVKIDGKVADILLGSVRELDEAATGAAEIVVAVPKGVPTELLAVDRGFGGHGYVVTFVEDGALKRVGKRAQVRVDAYVPSRNGALPLQVDFAPRSSGLSPASARGYVNTRWVSLGTH